MFDVPWQPGGLICKGRNVQRRMDTSTPADEITMLSPTEHQSSNDAASYPRRTKSRIWEYFRDALGRNSSVGIATRCGLDGPGIEFRWEARFSAPVQTGPGAYSASCTMGTGSFPGVKRPGRGADHPPPSQHRDHEMVGLYLYSPTGPQWPVIGRTFTFYRQRCFHDFFLIRLPFTLDAVPYLP